MRKFSVLVLEFDGKMIDNAYSNNLDFIPGTIWAHAQGLRSGVSIQSGTKEPLMVDVTDKGKIVKCLRCKFYHYADYRGECADEDQRFARITTDWREQDEQRVASRQDYI